MNENRVLVWVTYISIASLLTLILMIVYGSINIDETKFSEWIAPSTIATLIGGLGGALAGTWLSGKNANRLWTKQMVFQQLEKEVKSYKYKAEVLEILIERSWDLERILIFVEGSLMTVTTFKGVSEEDRNRIYLSNRKTLHVELRSELEKVLEVVINDVRTLREYSLLKDTLKTICENFKFVMKKIEYAHSKESESVEDIEAFIEVLNSLIKFKARTREKLKDVSQEIEKYESILRDSIKIG